MTLNFARGRDCGCTPEDARAFPQIGDACFDGHGTDLETTYTFKQCQECGAVWEHLRDTGPVGRNLCGYLTRLTSV